MSRTIAITMILTLPAAATAQLAGEEQSTRRHLSGRKTKDLAVKAPERPGAPRVFPTTGVAAIAFSPDKRWIATSDNLESIYLWDRQTGAAGWIMEGHSRWISRLEFSADSDYLLAGQDADSLHRATHWQELSVWKVATGELVRCHQLVDWSLSTDGKSLAVGRANRDEKGEGKLGDVLRFKGSTIDICNFPSHKIRCSISLPDKFVHALALSPDGRILAIGSRNEILFWDTATGEELPSITGLKERVHVLKFSPDGKTLASASDDLIPEKKDIVNAPGGIIKREVQLWDVATRKTSAVLKSDARWYFTTVQFIDAHTLVAGRFLHDFEIWNLDEGKVVRELQGVVRVFDDGKKLAHNQNERDRHGTAFFFEDAPKAKKQVSRSAMIHTPNGWFLYLFDDGSGYLQYGSGATDNWPCKAGTFEAEKVLKELKALKSDEKGSSGSHFVLHFESERKKDESPPARYSKDSKVILALFARAIDASEIRKKDRGAMLIDKHPPGLPKDK